MTRLQKRKVTRALVQALNTPASRSTQVKRTRVRAAFVAMFFVMFGGLAGLSMITSPSASADTAADSEPIKLTVLSTSYDEASVRETIKINNAIRLLVNGAHQVTWQNANHNVRITWAQVRKAPKLKLRATGADSSRVIYRKARGAKIVVLKRGSCVRNTGRENQLRVGFVWCLKHDAVLVFDSRSRQYRHAYDIINGKLYKKCLNYIGGKVPMRQKVVQLRYEKDVKYSGNLSVETRAYVDVEFSLECPTNGAYFKVKASALATGSGGASIRYTGRTRLSVINAKKIDLRHNALVNMSANAESSAAAKIDVEAYCGDSSDGPPVFLQFGEFNDLEVNWVDDHCVTVSFPEGHSGTIYWTAKFGSFAVPSKPASSGTQVCSDYKAPSEVPAGGTDTITVTVRDNTTGKTVTETTDPFVIHPTAGHPA